MTPDQTAGSLILVHTVCYIPDLGPYCLLYTQVHKQTSEQMTQDVTGRGKRLESFIIHRRYQVLKRLTRTE